MGENNPRTQQRSPYAPNVEAAKYNQGEHSVSVDRQYTDRYRITWEFLFILYRKTMRSFCIEHPDEEISYFCFDCLTNCVCSECVIHGPHKTHDVMTVKKSYGIVKTRVSYYI